MPDSHPKRASSKSSEPSSAAHEWKTAVRKMLGSKRPRSADIAEKMNALLGVTGTPDALTEPKINHWLSAPGATSLRVPTTGQLANAFVTALTELRVWENEPGKKTEKEKRLLVEKLGFKVADASVAVTRGLPEPTDRLHKALNDFCAHLTAPDRFGLMQVHSAIGFHVAWDQRLAEIVFDAVKAGMHCVYVAHSGWNESPPADVRRNLCNTLDELPKSAAVEQSGWRNHFWTLEIPSSPALPLASLFARVGVLSSFSQPFTAESGLKLLFAPSDVNIHAYWAHLSPDLSKRESADEQIWRFSTDPGPQVNPQEIRGFLRQMRLRLEESPVGRAVKIQPLFTQTL